MMEIRPIQPGEWKLAKRLIYMVAKEVFSDPLPVDEIMAKYEARGTLKEMDNIQANYFETDGIFLVMTVDGEMIGTGAIRRLDEDACELKRLWLLDRYQGRGLGYRMVQELLSFARAKGYKRIRLETDPVYQKRAVEFYKRLGFYEIAVPDMTDDEDILMEMIL